METKLARRTFLKGATSSAAVTLLSGTGLLVATPALSQISVQGSRKYGVKALVFDMFGTVLDLWTTWTRESEKILKPRGITMDWAALPRALMVEYGKSIAPVRDGTRPFANTDVLFRENLERALPALGVKGLPKEVLDELHLIWHRLDAWPDGTSGMAALRKNFLLSPCSNGSIAMMSDIARHYDIHFDAILGAEYARNYKPVPSVYIMTCEAFGLKTSEVMMVCDRARRRFRRCFQDRNENGCRRASG
jgi:2-haloacid dehalogenase